MQSNQYGGYPDKYGYVGPEKFKPLSPWAYFGYNLLFAIPVAGFIVLIVMCFNDTNINRRSYARSFFIGALIAAIVAAIVVALVALGVIGAAASSAYYY